jgi:hypothetical protein
VDPVSISDLRNGRKKFIIGGHEDENIPESVKGVKEEKMSKLKDIAYICS